MSSTPGFYDDPERSRRWATWALGLAVVPVVGAAAAAVLAGLVLSGPRDEQERGRRRAGIAIGVAVGGTAALVVALGIVLVVSAPGPRTVDASSLYRPGTATVVAGPGTHGEILLEDLVPGDCLDEDLDAVGFQRLLTVVGCEVPHLAQVAHVEDLPEGAYPGEGPTEDMTDALCLAAYGPWVGRAWEDSTLGLFYYFPTAESWEFDRSVTCIVTVESPTTGTLQGSGR
ncbi:septum formation family protein [Aeromicrobium sp. Leaf350]|uniref:septum formation family protein n=1 Tax=Aeromicrobium sp. Leaf350 TaxID=2876565 RepID=UPI001E40C5AA|nr:septum formation family protein [Aeromicrobium sp. Leaf350]